MQVSATDSIVGRRLRVYRVAKGFERAELGAAMRIDAETLGRYEDGLERMPARMLRAAAEILGVSLHAFFDPHNAKIVSETPVAPPPCVVEPAGDISDVVELLDNFGKIKDRELRSEILKFVAFLSQHP